MNCRNCFLNGCIDYTDNHRRKSNPATLSSALADNGSALIKREEPTHNLSFLSQPQASVNSIIISSQNTDNQTLMNSLNNSNGPLDPLGDSSRNLDSPDSPTGSVSFSSGLGGSPGRSCDSTSPHRDRRVGHIHAEQKRRYNIKNGFDMIHSLIPHLNQNPNAKVYINI